MKITMRFFKNIFALLATLSLITLCGCAQINSDDESGSSSSSEKIEHGGGGETIDSGESTTGETSDDNPTVNPSDDFEESDEGDKSEKEQPLLCASHDFEFEFIGEKYEGNNYHRAVCIFCGYEVVSQCEGYSYCRDCNRIAASDNSHVEYPQAFFEIDKSDEIPCLVIVANRAFENSPSLKKYIAHKRRQGFEIVLKFYSTGFNGTTAEQIRGDLKSLYEENQNRRVLIVGRGVAAQSNSIPEFVNKNRWQNRAAATDFYYGYFGDEESNLDLTKYVSVGRLSARNEEELSAQVEKIIFMEEEFSFDKQNVVLVQQISTQGEAYFGDETKALSSYFEAHTNHFVNEVATTNLASINGAIENGATLISYAGHGGATFWGSYNVAHVRQLRNPQIYPIVLGVTCNTGNFTDGDECLAEAFMRTKEGGAVGYIGASAAMIAYYSKAATVGNDKVPGMATSLFFSDKFEEKYSVKTLGGMFLAALRSIKMSKDYAGLIAKDYSIEVLNLFGDPTFMPYTDLPKKIDFNIEENQATNRTVRLVVQTNAPNAQVAITQVDANSVGGIKIVDAKVADDTGKVELDLRSAKAGSATLYAIGKNFNGRGIEILVED